MSHQLISVICSQAGFENSAQQLAQDLKLNYLSADHSPQGLATPFLLCVDATGVSLQQAGPKAPGPIRVDFSEGAVDHRRKFGGGKGQMIAKAVGISAHFFPRVLDATAGLGKDAFVLATLGCQLQLLERSPIAYALLEDGLNRARDFSSHEDSELLQIISRMSLLRGNSLDYLKSISEDQKVDVVYLDPMFPDRQKSAEVKKEMVAFHELIGKDEDADLLLEPALKAAHYRVVVKRPRKAPFLANKNPSYQLEGKSSRFDIYTLKKMPERLDSVVK